MKKIVLIGFIFSVLSSNAQDTLLLSIEKLNSLIFEQNLTIKSNAADFNLSKSEYQIQIGQVLPTISFGIRQYSLEGLTQSTEGNFVDVNKDNEFRGRSVTAKWNLSNLLFNSLSEKKKINAASYKNQSDNIDEKIKISDLFYDLAASQDSEKVLEQILTKNTEIFNQINLQYSVGLILESDLLMSKANLNNLHIKLLNQKKQTYKLNQRLISMLNVEGDYVIKIENDFYKTDLNQNIYADISQKATKRMELLSSNLLFQSEELQYKKQKLGFLLPNISVGLNDGMFGGLGLDPIGNQNFLTGSLMWNIPLSRLFPAGEAKKQQQILHIYSFEKEILKNELISEMRTLVSDLNLSNEQLEFAAQSVDFTKKAYSHSLQRHQLGTSNKLELFHAEKEYINAQLIYIELLSVMHKLKLKEVLILKEKVLH